MFSILYGTESGRWSQSSERREDSSADSRMLRSWSRRRPMDTLESRSAQWKYIKTFEGHKIIIIQQRRQLVVLWIDRN
jgi:hypothetical protein